ncbi:DNA-directed RNA polymerase subunit omega [candidate division KSB1 bacterium]|nr:DNA-directed RNA polymerase subunit omega [candidate division KSB1 bacterium]
MLTTLPLEELERNTENVYEAIIVIAKRARQINEEQKKVMDLELGTEDFSENYDEETEIVNQDKKTIRQPKPTTVALEEFLNGQLTYLYPKKL